MNELELDLEKLVGDHLDEIRDILNQPEHPSTFEDFDDFQFLNIRKIEMTQMSLSFASESFLIQGLDIFIYVRQNNRFKLLDRGHFHMAEILFHIYSGNQKIISGYSDEIEKLEDSLFERQVPSYFMDIWFDLKKDIAKIENFYYRNSLVYKEFYKKCEKSFDESIDDFKDVDDMIRFQSANLVTLKARMDSLHHYYASIKNDRLNKTLLVLTVISGVFLPLNLIVGFFGMNTEGLFFKDDPNATRLVLEILLVIVVIALLGGPVIKFIDKHVLRLILGRYNFYKSISNQIDKLDLNLK